MCNQLKGDKETNNHDGNYSCFADDDGVLLYYHSSEDCPLSKKALASARENFLNSLTEKQRTNEKHTSLIEKMFQIEKRINRGIDEFVLSIKARIPKQQKNEHSFHDVVEDGLIIEEEIVKKRNFWPKMFYL